MTQTCQRKGGISLSRGFVRESPSQTRCSTYSRDAAVMRDMRAVRPEGFKRGILQERFGGEDIEFRIYRETSSGAQDQRDRSGHAAHLAGYGTEARPFLGSGGSVLAESVNFDLRKAAAELEGRLDKEVHPQAA